MHHRLGPSSKLNTFGLNAASRTKKYDGKIAGLYDLEETLGRGHFAVVKLARHVFTGEKVAVKVIDKTKLDEVSKSHLFQEVRCMKLVQHPNVVRLYEVIDTATKLYLVLELGDGGDMYEYIMRHETGLPEKVAKEYFGQIVRAISYCHQLHVVHRDLKPENVVFFKKQGIVKLTDFGFSNKFYPGQKLETSCGSLAYSAPEILLGDSYDAPAVDVWSLGVILYMLVCGHPPFQEANDSETLTMIMDCKYDIPLHVSSSCRKLISRMLVRNPEKRATLTEIANHPWVNTGKQDNPDLLPLISREHLSEEDHNLIVQKIVNGNIATKEEIQDSLEKNDYNHITATYFLLAERKLRCKRQEQLNRMKRPEELGVIPDGQCLKTDSSASVKPSLLNVPRTPGDLPQRSRKCSIVQEDEEDEDINSCSGREDLGPQLNRRGSRSEGRLNFALQERLAEAEKKKPIEHKYCPSVLRPSEVTKLQNTDKNVIKIKKPPVIITPHSKSGCYETVAPLSSTNINCPSIGEILSRKENVKSTSDNMTLMTIVNRPYEQRKTKFHKNRTASCSSSDASDEDSEKRKKRAQKLSTPTKTIEGRRDSHDDSSDSQEPSSGTGASGVNSQGTARFTVCSSKGGNTDNQEGKDKNTNDQNERKHSDMNFRRTHKNLRKRNGSTRLRESQSLNRITEVQEDISQMVAIPVAPPNTPLLVPAKVKNVGTKILESLNKKNRKKGDEKYLKLNSNLRISRRDTVSTHRNFDITKTALEKADNCNKFEKCCIKKIRMLGKYFQVHKKICIPIAGIFCQNGIYKAQSCSSLTKGKPLNTNQELRNRCRGVSVVRTDDGDINQNETVNVRNALDINNVCNELTEICALHLQFGSATKCSFC